MNTLSNGKNRKIYGIQLCYKSRILVFMKNDKSFLSNSNDQNCFNLISNRKHDLENITESQNCRGWKRPLEII